MFHYFPTKRVVFHSLPFSKSLSWSISPSSSVHPPFQPTQPLEPPRGTKKSADRRWVRSTMRFLANFCWMVALGITNSQPWVQDWWFIVGLPMKHGAFPWFFVCLPEDTWVSAEIIAGNIDLWSTLTCREDDVAIRCHLFPLFCYGTVQWFPLSPERMRRIIAAHHSMIPRLDQWF